MCNTSDQSIQHIIDTFKNDIINERIAIIGLSEIKSTWSKIPIRENIYNRTDRWLKTRRFITGYNKVTISGGSFQSRSTYIIVADELSCREIATGQELINLGRWSWVFLRGKNNMRTRIITAYLPTASASEGVAYSQQLESLAIM